MAAPILVGIALCSPSCSSVPAGPTRPPAVLQREFLDLQFGMFLHFNLATYRNTEWVAGYHDPATFDPGGVIDTDAWADAAVAAGMKYMVLTAKHVSGFCLWDSALTTYDVMHPDCPYQRDLVGQFVASCKRRGLRAGLYYCWRHPGFGDPQKHKVLPPECDPATHTVAEQLAFQKAQVAELLQKYPDVFYLWNDALDDQVLPAGEITAHCRTVRPNVLTSSNWWDWGKKGRRYLDIAVTELRPFKPDNRAPGETCVKLERTWFWKSGARPRQVAAVLDQLATANGRSANLLLNVGPDPQGRIVPASVAALAEIGRRRTPRRAGSPPQVASAGRRPRP